MVISELFQYLIVPLVAIGSFTYCSVRVCRGWRNNPRNADELCLLALGALLSLFIGLLFWPGDVLEWFLVDVVIANIGYSILVVAMIAVPCIHRWQRRKNTPHQT
jgi:hypothetical protein